MYERSAPIYPPWCADAHPTDSGEKRRDEGFPCLCRLTSISGEGAVRHRAICRHEWTKRGPIRCVRYWHGGMHDAASGAGGEMSETRQLGASGIAVSALGVGTWSWGDGPFWGYGAAPERPELAAA